MSSQRGQAGDRADARARLAHARKMLEVADLVQSGEREIAASVITAAQTLRRILDEKGNAHQGLQSMGGQRLNALMRQAAGLVGFATTAVSGGLLGGPSGAALVASAPERFLRGAR